MKSDDGFPIPAPAWNRFPWLAGQGFVLLGLVGNIFVVWPKSWLFEIFSWLAGNMIDLSRLALTMMVSFVGAAVALLLSRRASRVDKYLSAHFNLSARAFGAWVAICALTVAERWPTRLEAALLHDLVVVAAFLALSALVAWGLAYARAQP